MKPHIILLVLITFVTAAWAGGPGAEMLDAEVVAMEKGPGGWVVVVNGRFDLVTAHGIVQLTAERARLQVPAGNQLYARRGGIHNSYEKRLQSTVGSRMVIQMWGPIVTISGGRVVEVVAGDISVLRPTKAEAAFDLGRLPEILQP